MKLNKMALVKKLDKIKGVVPKSSPMPALMGVLAKDGYLIASNTEMTIKTKLGGLKGESFIIPSRAFDLIKNLPEGELDITEGKGNRITISTEKIKNTYSSFPAEEYAFNTELLGEDAKVAMIDSKVLKNAISHVLYAIPSKSSNSVMTALYMQAGNGILHFVGLDGHVVALVQTEFDGEFELLVPRNAAEKLLALDIAGKVSVAHDQNCAVFTADEYEIHTRLINGKYIAYERFFENYEEEVRVKRADLLEAMVRVKLCTEELTPTRFVIEGNELCLSIRDRLADYMETVHLQSAIGKKMVIGFNSKLVLDTLKAHSDDEIRLKFSGSNYPMIVESESMKSIILPVKLRE